MWKGDSNSNCSCHSGYSIYCRDTRRKQILTAATLRAQQGGMGAAQGAALQTLRVAATSSSRAAIATAAIQRRQGGCGAHAVLQGVREGRGREEEGK